MNELYFLFANTIFRLISILIELLHAEQPHLPWTDALCITPLTSSKQIGQPPPASTEEASESVSPHRCGKSAQLLHLLVIKPRDSVQPECRRDHKF